MATYAITHYQRLDNYAVVQLLVNAEIQPGETVTLSGLASGFNGTQTVYAIPEYLYRGVDNEGDLILDADYPILNQVLFYNAGTDVERDAVIPNGTCTYTQTCTWITATNIEDWIGIGTATAADTAFLTQCAAAANAFCFRRRKEAGYTDSLTTSPSADVTLGTIQYGGALYRARGSVGDTFATFDGIGGSTNYVGMSALVKQLLGVDRPACA